mmetsp:Transcript_140084/g.355191  ORF Transcript_140084/g.355191 Transcript_140084/m.355191 type:complete len:217 (-) Transcript_140084:215-865(-)
MRSSRSDRRPRWTPAQSTRGSGRAHSATATVCSAGPTAHGMRAPSLQAGLTGRGSLSPPMATSMMDSGIRTGRTVLASTSTRTAAPTKASGPRTRRAARALRFGRMGRATRVSSCTAASMGVASTRVAPARLSSRGSSTTTRWMGKVPITSRMAAPTSGSGSEATCTARARCGGRMARSTRAATTRTSARARAPSRGPTAASTAASGATASRTATV